MDDLDFDAKTRYIAKYSGETVVIKCGGETLESPQALDHVLSQIVMLADAGVHVLMVHGGGAQIKAEAEARGVPEVKQDGVRITCAQTIPVVEDVLTRLNEKIIADVQQRVQQAGLDIDVLGGPASDFVVARQVEALGYVGEPESVDVAALKRRVSAGKINIIHPLSKDHNGQRLNVNADSIAGRLAHELGARRIIFCTSVPGVLDKDGHPIDTLTPERIERLIADETISGGMTKKVRECAMLLDRVKGVAIVASAEPLSIVKELLGDGGGTLIRTEEAAARAAAEADVQS